MQWKMAIFQQSSEDGTGCPSETLASYKAQCHHNMGINAAKISCDLSSHSGDNEAHELLGLNNV
jgi:hypothetical protein